MKNNLINKVKEIISPAKIFNIANPNIKILMFDESKMQLDNNIYRLIDGKIEKVFYLKESLAEIKLFFKYDELLKKDQDIYLSEVILLGDLKKQQLPLMDEKNPYVKKRI